VGLAEPGSGVPLQQPRARCGRGAGG